MSRKTFGVLLILAGAVVLIAAVAADVLGIGHAPGFGWEQDFGVVLGLLIGVIGSWLATR